MPHIQLIIHTLFTKVALLWFRVRFSYYKTRFGGGDKIPSEIVRKLIGQPNEQTHRVLKTLSIIQSVMEAVNLKIADSQLAVNLVAFDNGTIMNTEAYQELLEFLSEPVTPTRVIENLIEFGDIQKHQLEYHGSKITEILESDMTKHTGECTDE